MTNKSLLQFGVSILMGFSLLTLGITAHAATSDETFFNHVRGRILLQVEEHGEAWYVNPNNTQRYYMKDGDTAYAMMRYLSLGITNADLVKIPSVTSASQMLSSTSACSSNTLVNRVKGRILLQVEKHGEAWYVHPDTCQRIYMKDGDTAYNIMRYLSLGITNEHLSLIPISSLPSLEDPSVDTDLPPDDKAPLIGFWGLNGYHTPAGLEDVKNRFDITVFQVSSADPTYTVKTLLPMVQEAGLKITLRMSQGHAYLTTNGGFDIGKWKEDIAAWKNSGVQEYIDNGTLVGHMLLDDIHNFSGHDASADELDEMAQYSEEILPGLMTFVRDRATTIPVPEDGTYDYLDAVVNQYLARNGDVEEYTQQEAAQAEELNVGIINGLNITDGGDGSSGQPGWRKGYWAMSSEEIAEYSEVLLSVPNVLMFLMWEYDAQEEWSDGSIGSEYFDQEEFEKVISDIGG